MELQRLRWAGLCLLETGVTAGMLAAVDSLTGRSLQMTPYNLALLLSGHLMVIRPGLQSVMRHFSSDNAA